MVWIDVGDIGMKGGFVIDVYVCVLCVDGELIDGFYVIGNISVLMMGVSYFGVGLMFGLVMIFGYFVVDYLVVCVVDVGGWFVWLFMIEFDGV